MRCPGDGAATSAFCYNFLMTIGIAGPKQKAARRRAVAGFLIAAIIVGTGLILLGLLGDFLADWMWFSSIGYRQVFWTTFGAKAGVFFMVFRARSDRGPLCSCGVSTPA